MFRRRISISWHIWYLRRLNCLLHANFIFTLVIMYFPFFRTIVDSYGLDNDEFNTEELEEAVADIQDTLGADNYEDQLPQPEVNMHFKIHEVHHGICFVFRMFHTKQTLPSVSALNCSPHLFSIPFPTSAFHFEIPLCTTPHHTNILIHSFQKKTNCYFQFRIFSILIL